MIGKKISKNYIFNYHLDSLAEKDIDKIIEIQENCFSYITNVLKVDFKEKIEYYLCSSKEEVGEFYGDNDPCSGFAREPNKVYAVYNEINKCLGFHEDAHLISYKINTPKSAAFREGLAMFFDRNWWDISNSEWVKYYLKENRYERVESLINDDYFYEVDCSISYPTMGCFTEYLILTYGIDKYLKFYSYEKEDFIKSFELTYEKSLYEVEEEFISYLNLFKLDKSIEERLKELTDKDSFNKEDLKISQMLKLSYNLWEKNKDKWSPMEAEHARSFILYMIEEIGEAISIIKKKGEVEIMNNPEVRVHFVEELGDVLMYFMDVLNRFNISYEEFSRSYVKKYLKNINRDYEEQYKKFK